MSNNLLKSSSVSLIVTILNEEKTIIPLLKSIEKQVLIPNEVIIVDGGSTDKTINLVKKFIKKCSKFSIKIFIKKGNRSVGRNYAIRKAKNKWIAITDAGCVLDKNWLKELVKKQDELGVKVISGYYKAITKTPFEEAVVPYVLVMSDKINEDEFLPATRSVLFSKNIWKSMGGFNEKFSDNEDYEFAKRLKSSGTKIGFAKNAVVGWMPRKTLRSFNKMIFRFARGDIYAGIVRPKVLLIFARYLLGFSVFLWGTLQLITVGSFWILFGLILGILPLYILWSIYKNYRYAPSGWYWLPVLQFSSDIAAMVGSIFGLIWLLRSLLQKKIIKG